jgi:hypothetical protein
MLSWHHKASWAQCTVPFHYSPSSLISFSPVTLSRGSPLVHLYYSIWHIGIPTTISSHGGDGSSSIVGWGEAYFISLACMTHQGEKKAIDNHNIQLLAYLYTYIYYNIILVPLIPSSLSASPRTAERTAPTSGSSLS